MPLSTVLFSPPQALIFSVPASALVFLAVLGALGAKTDGADIKKGTIRVPFWGAIAMVGTAAVGSLFGMGG